MNIRNAALGHANVRAVGAAAAGLIGLAVLRSVVPAGTPPIRRASAASGHSVAVLEKVRIGGSDQWILERSEDTRNPIILFVHGGPGTSELTLNRRNTRTLERYFTVVNWDQRGAGKSYAAIRDTERMNIEQFVDDVVELTRLLLNKFDQEKLVLVGHSWGTVIGAMAAARFPELYSCYVGIGQMADMRAGEAISHRWTLEQAVEHRDRKAVRALEAMGPPPYQHDWQRNVITQRRYLGRYGGEVHAVRNGGFRLVILSLLFSREYTVVDRVNFFRGIFGSMRILWPKLMDVNLFAALPEIAVPVVLMEGRYDKEVPAEVSAEYFESLRAPCKQLIWFENSAHFLNSEERDLFNQTVISTVLPLAIAGRRAGNPHAVVTSPSSAGDASSSFLGSTRTV